jgi:hypothetical protein
MWLYPRCPACICMWLHVLYVCACMIIYTLPVITTLPMIKHTASDSIVSRNASFNIICRPAHHSKLTSSCSMHIIGSMLWYVVLHVAVKWPLSLWSDHYHCKMTIGDEGGPGGQPWPWRVSYYIILYYIILYYNNIIIQPWRRSGGPGGRRRRRGSRGASAAILVRYPLFYHIMYVIL